MYDTWVDHLSESGLTGSRAAGRVRSTGSVAAMARSYQPLARWAKRELTWLNRHTPKACYADDYDLWTEYVRLTESYATKVQRAARTIDNDLLAEAVSDQAEASMITAEFGTADG